MRGFFSLHETSADGAARFTNTRAYETIEEIVSDCDVLFLTVPDGRIAQVFDEIRRLKIENKIVCHCSGALCAGDAFAGIAETGAYGYSVHPLFAVSDRYHAYEELPDVFFALEGSAEKLEDVRGMLTGVGLTVQVIRPESKVKYHAAAVMGSNLVVGLARQSLLLLEECGFSEENALKALGPLMLGNMKHVTEDGPVKSLTGPVERNDTGTVEKHLACLDDEYVRGLYVMLSEAVVEIAKLRHPDGDYSLMERILKGETEK